MKKVLLIGTPLFLLFITAVAIGFGLQGRTFLFFFPSQETQGIFKGENCESFPELFKRNWCYKSSALHVKDPSICEKMVISPEDETSSQNKEFCYMDIARSTKNPAFCANLNMYKQRCLSESK